eukprot:CAMPEP_0184734528 /NCGR_PEP_ID=MMETSP0314-20130426/60775_1 /TAXON_ID=38298 /ORGANISM="Rhodella maculata, Strain CCMP 736" /LENGTH=282 /DNA_ID=CAMNT_0027201493 /DNA_START=27 /DNA_END=875 /DNA_ORIENTATION=+
MPALYSDIGKTAKKILSDDFFSETKVTVKSKSKSGVTYSFGATQPAAADAPISGDIGLKLKLPHSKGTTANLKLLTASVATLELTNDAGLGLPGLKLVANLKAPVASAAGAGAAARVEYVHDVVALKGGVDALKRVLDASAVAGYKGVSVGADVAFDAKKNALAKYEFCAAFSDGGEAESVVALIDKLDKIKASYSHKLSATFSVAASILYSRKDASKLLTMAAKIAVDNTTTVKARIDSTGALAAAYIHDVSPGTTIVLSAATNVAAPQKVMKVGLSLAIE